MIGERLAALLEQKKMRAGTLATRTGIPKATIYSIIRRNTKNVDYSVLTRIAQELSVPVSYFFENDFSAERIIPISDAQQEEFLNLYKKLTNEQKQFILDAMRGLLHQ